MRYDLQTRPSRFKAAKTLLALARLKGLWSPAKPEAA